MIARLSDAEDFASGKPVKLVVLKLGGSITPGERAFFRAMRNSTSRHMRVTFDLGSNEMRLVVPEDVTEDLRK